MWTDDIDCDAVLRWLDVHSVSISQGLPLHFVQTKWKRAGRGEDRLNEALLNLIGNGWVEMAPSQQTAHVRLTATGYARMLAYGEPVSQEAQAELLRALGATQGTIAIREGQVDAEANLRQLLQLYAQLGIPAEGRLIATTLSRYWQESGYRLAELRTALDLALEQGFLRQRQDGIEVFWILTSAGAQNIRDEAA